MESDDTTSSWTSTTNWTTVRGTLVNSITFESSFSSIDDETSDLNSTPKRPPLILKPTASDSGPCEITVSFAQKHELGQIYVKSTARVYEIYYASNLQSDKEYLCTVRCGAAARDDDEEVHSVNSNGSHDNPSKENSGNDSNRSASEDEWVEVKVLDGSLTLIKTDYYEATAQMNDLNPCQSITIRLLSVQSKDAVFIDEVYVFADPVDATDLENQVGQTENSNGNSLMAMLMPTLLQMSKTNGSTRTQDKNSFETWRKPNFQESPSEAACSSSTNVATEGQKDGSLRMDNKKVELQSVNMTGVDATELQRLPQVSLGETKAGDCPTNDRVEKGLDQLCARMARIEDLFLRLEENLLKPINRIEARLDRVEQQLEVLTNKEKNSELPSYSRFCAPNFSSVQSDSNSFYRSEIDSHHFEEFESNAKSFHSDMQTNQADDVSYDTNATQMLPGLVVTAPDFSNCDDDNGEEDQASERATESSVDEARRPLTVDDALASALAGFASSISIQVQNHTPALSVKAPEFPNDEDTNGDEKDSPRGEPDTRTDGTESESGLLSNACHPSLVDGSMNVVKSLDHDQSERTAEEVDVRCKDTEEGDEDKSSGRHIEENDAENEEVITEASEDLVHNKTDAIGSDTKEEDATSIAESAAAAEIPKDGSEIKESDDLRDILVFSQAAPSVVDFESPVLDVKFLSQDSRDSSFSLEALLYDMPESEPGEANCVEESRDTIPSDDEQSDLISVEHGDPLGPAFSSQIFVDFNYCTLQEKEQEPLSREAETPPLAANNIPCSHENFPPSLI